MLTETEKMYRHMLYDANYDEELLRARAKCKDLCQDFNNLRPSDTQGQEKLLRRILGSAGEACAVVAPFWCDYGYHIEVGDYFFANHNTVILDGAKVKFGNHVFIGPDCGFYTAGHPVDFERRNRGLEYAWPITVGDNVWIGAGVHVMPGVTIGSNVVIGAGSIVNRDIPDNVIAVGNPCRVLRPITEKDAENPLEYRPGGR